MKQSKFVLFVAVSLLTLGMMVLSADLSSTKADGLTPCLVGAYHFDEGEGDVAYDSSGYENDGILGPDYPFRFPSWIEGVYGSALSFDHTHAVVEIPQGNLLNPVDLSISAWIRTESNKTKRMIVCQTKNFSKKAGGYGFCVSPPGGKGRLGFWSSGNARWVIGNSRVDDGQWHQVAVTLEGDECCFYIDGKLDAVASSASPLSNEHDVTIGGWNDGKVAFDGEIDEVKIYNCAIPDPNWRDIVINEINFAANTTDPLFPEIGFEYVELYNRGDLPVTLDGWYLMDREVHLYTFPSGDDALTMPPGSFLVIFSSAAEGTITEDRDLSDGSGRLIAGAEWSTYELTNSGDSVQIYASTELNEITIVDFVAFDELNVQKYPEVDEIAVAAGIWSDDAAIDTLSASASRGRAIYLIEDGQSPHETSGNDEEDLDWAQYRSNEGGTPGALNPPPPPVITPTPSLPPTPTPAPTVTLTPTITPVPPTPIPTPYYLINEGFDGFHTGTRPAGWLFLSCNQNWDTYTTANNFGDALPSLKLDATGDTIITKTFSSPATLSFWVKGMNTDSTSCLLVEEYYSSSGWTQVTQITKLPTTGTTYGALSLNPSSSQVKFYYSKSVGNLAFDDVRVGD